MAKPDIPQPILPFETPGPAQESLNAPPETDTSPDIPRKLDGFEKTDIRVSDINHQTKTALCWYHDGVIAEWQLVQTPDGSHRAVILFRISNGTSNGTFIAKHDIATSIKMIHALFEKRVKEKAHHTPELPLA